MLRRRAMLAASATAAVSAPFLAGAQGWPSRPVRVLVPYPPGSGTDIIGRVLAERLQATWGQPVVIERLFRTLKDQAIHGRIFQTIDDVRNAVRAFVARYNAEWLVEKNGYRSPAEMRTAWQAETFRRAA